MSAPGNGKYTIYHVGKNVSIATKETTVSTTSNEKVYSVAVKSETTATDIEWDIQKTSGCQCRTISTDSKKAYNSSNSQVNADAGQDFRWTLTTTETKDSTGKIEYYTGTINDADKRYWKLTAQDAGTVVSLSELPADGKATDEYKYKFTPA